MPFPALLVVLALVAPPQPAAETAPELARLLALKSFPIADSDGALLKLQKERFNARLEAARLQVQALRSGVLNLQQFNDLLGVLASNGADVAEKPEDKVKWMELRVEVLKSQEDIARRRAEAGVENASASLLAKASRIDAEIDLLKLKDSLKGDKGIGGRK